MKAYLRIVRLWRDADLVEVEFSVCDGCSRFVHAQYVGPDEIDEWAGRLQAFGEPLREGLLACRLGDAATGSFHARLHCDGLGRLAMATCQQGAPAAFLDQPYAPGANLLIHSEPALLDRFIAELRDVAAGVRTDATLEGI